MNNKPSIAQLAFEAYSAERGNTAYDGSPIPEWDNAKPEIRNAWVTASATAVKAYMDECRGRNRIDINTYSAQVRDLRRQNNLSQDELAQKAGLSRTYISLIERGQAKNITVGALRKIYAALQPIPACQSDEMSKIPTTPEIISEHGVLITACATYDEMFSSLLDWADNHSHFGRDARSQEHRRALIKMLDKARGLSRSIVIADGVRREFANDN
jgi:transcriptional regulator with XRE-family HTH domain